MNPLLTVALIFAAALTLYLIFLGIGFIGVLQNRKVQGLGEHDED